MILVSSLTTSNIVLIKIPEDMLIQHRLVHKMKHLNLKTKCQKGWEQKKVHFTFEKKRRPPPLHQAGYRSVHTIAFLNHTIVKYLN